MGFLSMTIDPGNLSNYMTSMAFAADVLDQALNVGIEAVAEDAQIVLQEDAPEGPKGEGVYSDAPGHLADSFYYTPPEVSGGIGSSTVETSQPAKLLMVTGGTGIYGPVGYPIVPREKRALSWGGADHPVRSVRGMPPRDFVTPAQQEIADRALSDFMPALDVFIQALNNAQF